MEAMMYQVKRGLYVTALMTLLFGIIFTLNFCGILALKAALALVTGNIEELRPNAYMVGVSINSGAVILALYLISPTGIRKDLREYDRKRRR